MKKRKRKYRSLLERKIVLQLKKQRVKFEYESLRLEYTVPSRGATYTPDFRLPSGIVVEAKGRLTKADRNKMLLVRLANPHLDIRFVFQRASNPIYTGSKTTYADWATKNNFKFADKGIIPDSWLNE